MNIMVTNDDGIHAAGICALAEAMNELGTVTVVAPDRERSAVGHSLTVHTPLRIFELRKGWYAVDGTPTDCVNMGIHNMLPITPDLIVSGPDGEEKTHADDNQEEFCFHGFSSFYEMLLRSLNVIS